MGMDINGLAPSSPEGEYFQTSIWRWPAILDLCKEAIERFSLEIDTSGWQHNDGKGCRSSEKCIALAGGLDRLLEDSGEVVKAKSRSEVGDALLSIFGGAANYETSATQVREFCSFLRACGGFEIH